jgi:hypothetical protein
MKTSLTILTTCLVLMTAGILTLLIWQQQQNRALLEANRQLTWELQQSEARVTALTADNAEVASALEILESSEQQLRSRVDSLEEAASATAQITPQPYRVRAFLGQDNVGDAWIVPHNVTRDPETGRYLYEPLLVIEKSARKYFTEYRTNVVEREVYSTEVHDNYYPYYVAYGTRHPTNRPPAAPRIPSQQGYPRGLSSPPADARSQLFAPPMSIVNSRPQVLGTPATSPVNATMFAP